MRAESTILVRRNGRLPGSDQPRETLGGHMELQIVLTVIVVVALLVGGTVFAAWRSERAEDEKRDEEPDRSA